MGYLREAPLALFLLFFLYPGVGLLGAMLAFALALQAPRAEFGRCVGWLAMATAFMAVALVETPATLRIAVTFLMLLGVFLNATILGGMTIAFRAILSALKTGLRRRGGGGAAAAPAIARSSAMNAVQPVSAGVLAALVLDLLARWQLHGLRPAWAAHALVAAAIVLLWAAAAPLRRLPAAGGAPRWKAALRSFATGLCATWLIVVGAEAGFSLYVAQRAAAIAGDAPYCIQTAGRQRSYQPAETLLDLSLLTMRPKYHNHPYKLGMYGVHHALLVVGEGARLRLFNWSYGRGHFDAETYARADPRYWPPLYCIPQRQFAAHLPLLFGGGGRDPLFVRIGGRGLAIPLAYQPTIGIDDANPSIIVAAAAPDFQPLVGPPLRPQDPNWLDSVAWIFFAPGNRLDSYARPAANDRIESLGEEFGLEKRKRRWSGGSLETIEYVARDPDGRVTMLAWCGPRSAGDLRCREQFLRDGLLFDFSHPAADLPQWRLLQQRLVDLLDSWDVEKNATNGRP